MLHQGIQYILCLANAIYQLNLAIKSKEKFGTKLHFTGRPVDKTEMNDERTPEQGQKSSAQKRRALLVVLTPLSSIVVVARCDRFARIAVSGRVGRSSAERASEERAYLEMEWKNGE